MTEIPVSRTADSRSESPYFGGSLSGLPGMFCFLEVQVLIGNHLEPRREFIEKHALDVKDLDI